MASSTMLTMQLRLGVKKHVKDQLELWHICHRKKLGMVSNNRPTNQAKSKTAFGNFFAILRPHLTCDRQGRPSLSSPICLPAICNVQYRIYLPANRHNFCRHIHQIILVDGDSDKIVQVVTD